MKIELNGLISPYRSAAGIKLYTTIRQSTELLMDDCIYGQLIDNICARFSIQGQVELWYHLINQKLFKIAVYKGYRGTTLNGIGIGTGIEDAKRLDTSIVRREDEREYLSSQGTWMQVDPETQKIESIAIFVREMQTDNFRMGNW